MWLALAALGWPGGFAPWLRTVLDTGAVWHRAVIPLDCVPGLGVPDSWTSLRCGMYRLAQRVLTHRVNSNSALLHCVTELQDCVTGLCDGTPGVNLPLSIAFISSLVSGICRLLLVFLRNFR